MRKPAAAGSIPCWLISHRLSSGEPPIIREFKLDRFATTKLSRRMDFGTHRATGHGCIGGPSRHGRLPGQILMLTSPRMGHIPLPDLLHVTKRRVPCGILASCGAVWRRPHLRRRKRVGSALAQVVYIASQEVALDYDSVKQVFKKRYQTKPRWGVTLCIPNVQQGTSSTWVDTACQIGTLNANSGRNT